jgi:hypothetical protein
MLNKGEQAWKSMAYEGKKAGFPKTAFFDVF